LQNLTNLTCYATSTLVSGALLLEQPILKVSPLCCAVLGCVVLCCGPSCCAVLRVLLLGQPILKVSPLCRAMLC